ncbi:hypothetical protein Xlen_02370 [Xanthomonas campestris pv. leeana]|nr:hypothetical protein Xths_02735 [Xanthomonas campestris pv. thespesiae]OOW78322.1 hypothetical protein Xlen_02370 [Xanthomonas campestris pv. leeana]
MELTHPILYENLPTTSSAVKKPLIFIGKVEEKFLGIPFELSAGPLEFEAYLFWAPKIAPPEHQGSLVRVNGASGTLFDPTFMRYQIQELQRLKQITCEIFVTRGLDSALNIDRESFNVAHPHAVYITKWLHSALRQLATVQKRVASEIRGDAREIKEQVKLSAIQRIANTAWKEQSGDETSEPPEVYFESPQSKKGIGKDAYVFDRSVVVPTQLAPRARETAQSRIVEQKVKAIAQVLASFDLLDALSKKKQQSLLKAIYEILESGE